MALLTLHAGPLIAEYEGGSLRYIRWGGREVLRRVVVAVRDRHWNTIPAVISHETINNLPDRFQVTFRAEHLLGDVDFAWEGSIHGEPNGTIRWTMSGQPRRVFWRNRIGFCVLHPIAEYAGRECVVEHSDGTRESARFPELIAPYQPFKDVKALWHEVAPGVQACVRTGGDIFETEDQRNWSDASFKTYSTPLQIPFPVAVGPGDVVQQEIELTLAGEASPRSPREECVSECRIVADRLRGTAMPALSVCDASAATSFVELNRNRRAGAWGIDPRVHADDDLTMIENLAGQAPAVHTARTFMGGAPIHISPVLVPPIRAANAWVAVSISELAQAGVVSIAYNRAEPVIEEACAFAAKEVLRCRSAAPLKCGALVLRSGSRVCAWVANFLPTPQTVALEDRQVEVAPFGLRAVELERMQ